MRAGNNWRAPKIINLAIFPMLFLNFADYTEPSFFTHEQEP